MTTLPRATRILNFIREKKEASSPEIIGAHPEIPKGAVYDTLKDLFWKGKLDRKEHIVNLSSNNTKYFIYSLPDTRVPIEALVVRLPWDAHLCETIATYRQKEAQNCVL
jgi:hypothetical protein